MNLIISGTRVSIKKNQIFIEDESATTKVLNYLESEGILEAMLSDHKDKNPVLIFSGEQCNKPSTVTLFNSEKVQIITKTTIELYSAARIEALNYDQKAGQVILIFGGKQITLSQVQAVNYL